MTCFYDKKSKKKNFLKKNQNCRLKKIMFFKITNYQYFLWKYHGLVLGLVELIDVKGIDVAQPTYMAVRLSDKCSKTGKKYIFCVFRPFLSLCRTDSWLWRLSHIINPTNPRTNPRIFWEKYWELAVLKNSIFLSQPF